MRLTILILTLFAICNLTIYTIISQGTLGMEQTRDMCLPVVGAEDATRCDESTNLQTSAKVS